MTHFSPVVASEASELVGRTPLVKLQCSGALAEDCGVNIFGKLESMNPCSSVKDRIVCSMLHAAEAAGDITPTKTVLIEPTSGNTGIALAFIAVPKGYRVILVMPDSLSMERRIILLSLGAELVLTPACKGVKGVLDKVNHMLQKIENSFMLNQFANPNNARAHYETTGPEIFQSSVKCDVFVSAVGTGGTITGAGRFLKENVKDVRIVAVEPTESAVLSGGAPGPHMIQGIGAGMIPDLLDTSVYDEVVTVSSEEALTMARKLAREEGLLVGISSGAAVTAACKIARRPGMCGKNIIVILPSSGERYLSTVLFEEERQTAEAMVAL